MEPPANACQKRLSVLEPLRSHRDFGRILARPPQSICLAQTTGSFGLPKGCDPAFYRRSSRFSALENHAGPCGSGRLRWWSITAGTAEVSSQWLFRHHALLQRIPQPGAKNPKAPRASADPGSTQDCFAGCEAQHQQTAFAKRKRQDAVFRVKTVPRLTLRACMESRIIREGLPMSREPALLTSGGRMPERSQHRVSEGHGWP